MKRPLAHVASSAPPLPLSQGWGDAEHRALVGSLLCALYRRMRHRLLAPLRISAASFFSYMRLSEEQCAPHPGVAVPLRLLKLLVRHPSELQADFTAVYHGDRTRTLGIP